MVPTTPVVVRGTVTAFTPVSDADPDGRVVRTQLGVACATFVTATLLSAVARPSTDWGPVPFVVLGRGLPTAASDRGRPVSASAPPPTARCSV